jgi:hypothetical protein
MKKGRTARERAERYHKTTGLLSVYTLALFKGMDDEGRILGKAMQGKAKQLSESTKHGLERLSCTTYRARAGGKRKRKKKRGTFPLCGRSNRKVTRASAPVEHLQQG